MKRILMLCGRMSMGFGVSVVVDQLSRGLKARGIEVIVGCLEHDDHFSDGCVIQRLAPNPQDIDEFIQKHAIDLVIAHTTPYFEQLPLLQSSVERWAWEHGDPTPSLFPHDQQERQAIIDHKRLSVYPKIDKVIAISEFIRQDIGWPEAMVIYNGADHLPVRKPRLNPNNPLRIGMLVRMGEGERFYKGGDLFCRLAQQLTAQSDMIFSIMGRGSEQDAEYYRAAGIEVHLNATDEERSDYLENLDIFMSLSLWEGFNLPLVEAQVSGKLGIALDVGAHPEVTPFIATGSHEIEELLLALNENRSLLFEYSNQAQQHCLNRFRWSHTIETLASLLT